MEGLSVWSGVDTPGCVPTFLSVLDCEEVDAPGCGVTVSGVLVCEGADLAGFSGVRSIWE